MSGQREFGVEHLLAAYLQKRRWSDADPDLQGYHARRYAALAAAFGADLDQPPKEGGGAKESEPSWFAARAAEQPDLYRGSWSELSADRERSLASLFDATVRQLERLGSPFDGFMEAPPIVIAFYKEYAAKVSASVDQTRKELTTLLREVACTLWSLDPDATVSGEALRAHGFDPDQGAPDPVDYW